MTPQLALPSFAGPGAALPLADAQATCAGAHDDPFSVLGPHPVPGGIAIRVFAPDADQVHAISPTNGRKIVSLDPVPGADGVFCGFAAGLDGRPDYRLRLQRGGASWQRDDAYRFGPVLGEFDLHLLGEGAHLRLWRALGAHVVEHEGVAGTHFAVWAPSAQRVSVVADFNHWDGRRHVMRACGACGIWEIFVPDAGEGTHYKYEIRLGDGTILPLKADPVGFGSEQPPATASIVRCLDPQVWRDAEWIAGRARSQSLDAPISIYEVHAASWRRAEGRPLAYRELAEQLVGYAAGMGFTHVELLPVSEHPYDGSWGYQPIGLYAPTSRHGSLGDFRHFVDAAHRAGLGVILDWVPGHFPADAHGLRRFDGTALYEHLDPREGLHPDWDTLIYNLGRREVRNFLIANALYWMEEHHADGLRVDAVASMLYRDYSRKDGEWVPNRHGGRENLEAVAFLRELNERVFAAHPGVQTMAEESTAWPGVSRPTSAGGLGFGFKWNMGWMHDTLEYMSRDPIHRNHHHHQMTFASTYASSENFILPLSHDEVVHGKRSLLGKMPGEGATKFANLRAYFGFMWTHPGKKLLFMGGEFAQGREWCHDGSLDWHLLDDPGHRGVQRLVRDLNQLYRETPALHRRDCTDGGFEWLEADANAESVYAFARYGLPGDAPVVVICNFTPVERPGWRVGLPVPGRWRIVINTSDPRYADARALAEENLASVPLPWQGKKQSLALDLPGLSALVLRHEP